MARCVDEWDMKFKPGQRVRIDKEKAEGGVVSYLDNANTVGVVTFDSGAEHELVFIDVEMLVDGIARRTPVAVYRKALSLIEGEA